MDTGHQIGMVFSPRRNLSENLRICDLLDTNSGGWNIDKVEHTFLPFKRDRVLSISISNRLPEDGICWDLEKNVKYNVRSANRQSLEMMSAIILLHHLHQICTFGIKFGTQI